MPGHLERLWTQPVLLLMCISSINQSTGNARRRCAFASSSKQAPHGSSSGGSSSDRSITIIPPRLTMRELEARRRRAEEGWERVQAAQERMEKELERVTLGEHDVGSAHEALNDPYFQRLSKEVLEEMEARWSSDAAGDAEECAAGGYTLECFHVLCVRPCPLTHIIPASHAPCLLFIHMHRWGWLCARSGA